MHYSCVLFYSLHVHTLPHTPRSFTRLHSPAIPILSPARQQLRRTIWTSYSQRTQSLCLWPQGGSLVECAIYNIQHFQSGLYELHSQTTAIILQFEVNDKQKGLSLIFAIIFLKSNYYQINFSGSSIFSMFQVYFPENYSPWALPYYYNGYTRIQVQATYRVPYSCPHHTSIPPSPPPCTHTSVPKSAPHTFGLASSIGREVGPKDGVVDVATTVESHGRTELNNCLSVPCTRVKQQHTQHT